MTMYRVTWEIDIEADDAIDAARQALEIHRDPDSIATVFSVQEYGTPNGIHPQEIDLLEVGTDDD